MFQVIDASRVGLVDNRRTTWKSTVHVRRGHILANLVPGGGGD